MRVTFKTWRKSTLTANDFDFSNLTDWPKHALNVAWLWELEREIGSGRGPFFSFWQIHELKRILAKLNSDELLGDEMLALMPKGYELTGASFRKAFASLKTEIREREQAYFEDRWTMGKSAWLTKAPLPPRPMLYSHLLAEVSSLVKPGEETWRKEVHPGGLQGERSGACGAYLRIHALEIDWTKTETELVEAFTNWLRDGKHSFQPDQQLYSRPRQGKRNTEGLLSYLRDLAIYRTSEAGFTCREGLKKLGLNMTAQNWAHAKAKTKKRILERVKTLYQCAELEAVGGGKKGFWKDYFIGMDALDNAPCV